MSDNFYTRANNLAREYWNLRGEQKPEEEIDLNEVQRKIDDLEKRSNRFPNGSPLKIAIEAQVKILQEQKHRFKSSTKEFLEIRKQLLELTAKEFEVDPQGGKKLSEQYLQALTQLLFAKPRNRLKFHNCTIEPDGIQTVEDEAEALLTIVKVSEFIQEAARKILGEENIMDELWKHAKHECGTMFKVYSILALNDKPLGIEEIKSLISDQEWDKRKVQNNLVNLLLDHIFDHKLIRRVGRGKYQVSDAGRFLWSQYSSVHIKKETNNLPFQHPDALNKWIRTSHEGASK